MAMISLPLWPTLAAVGSLLIFLCIVFKWYEDDIEYVALGLASTVVIPFTVFFIAIGIITTCRGF